MFKIIKNLSLCVLVIGFVSCNQIVETVYYSQLQRNDTITFDDYKYAIDSKDRRAYLTKDNELMDGHYVVKRNNTLYEEFDLDEGYLDGLFIRYQENGSIESYQTFSNSYQHGKSYEAYENGNIKIESNYVNGKKGPQEKEYDINGNLSVLRTTENEIKYEHHYQNDKRIVSSFEKTIDGQNFEIILKYTSFGSVDFIIGKDLDSQDPILYVFDEDYNLVEKLNATLEPERTKAYLMSLSQF